MAAPSSAGKIRKHLHVYMAQPIPSTLFSKASLICLVPLFLI